MRNEFTLPQLAAAVGMTERNVRAYRSRGLISPPRLRGRVGYYGIEHLTQLRLVQALTGRGLSLQVVGQLVDRGLAQHELARLIRQDLPEGPPLPFSPPVIEELSRSDPRLVEQMVEEGVASSTPSGPVADPALLALAFQLAGHGVPAPEVARVLLTGARAAGAAEAEVRQVLSVPRQPPPREPVAEPDEPGSTGCRAAETTEPDTAALDGVAPDSTDGDADDGVAATVVALELAATAFRIALGSRLSRPAR